MNQTKTAYLVGYFKKSEQRNYVYCLFHDREEAKRFISDANNDEYLGKDRNWNMTALKFMDE